MASPPDWEIPAASRPVAEGLAYDLHAALEAVVRVKAMAPEDAFTAGVLGVERIGSGVVIDGGGLVLTIGYLITEAETIWLTTGQGRVVPGDALGYDHETGFGLVQALGRLEALPVPLGSARRLSVGQPAVFASEGGLRRALATRIVSKREFAGSWEYALEEALFTAPAHPSWGGAALLDGEGALVGIGSLLVQDASGGPAPLQGNMVVPIDLLLPILDELRTMGRRSRPARPWLGMYVSDSDDQLMVVGLARQGPASRAGLRPGDELVSVAGHEAAALAPLYRHIWALGPAGVDVPLTVRRDGRLLSVTVRSSDRSGFLRGPRLH